MSAVAALLADGRLHLQHGPIDCVCQAWGEREEVRAAYRQAAGYFDGVLAGLCGELGVLRAGLPGVMPEGAVARAMVAACLPFADGFITPMAAVAGAVADAVLAAMVDGRTVSRAFVNNGGDIAFFLAPGEALRCGLVTDLGRVFAGGEALGEADVSWPSVGPRATTSAGGGEVVGGRATPGHDTLRDLSHTSNDKFASYPSIDSDGTFLLTSGHPARGLATSGRACKGRGGRSFSFGIADSVSVLARRAAQADAAATVVGNAVDLPGHASVDRRPACAIDPDSDLGERLVTFDVGGLSAGEVRLALDAGAAMAEKLLRAGLIAGAVLALRGVVRVVHPELELA